MKRAVILVVFVLVATVGFVPRGVAADPEEGFVYVTRGAQDSHAVDRLDDRFALVGIPRHIREFPDGARGVVIAADDLDRPRAAAFVQHLFDAGLTVALVDADAVSADALSDLVGRSYPVGLDEAGGSMPLVALRDDVSSGKLAMRTHLLHEREESDGGTVEGHRSADESESDFLLAAFNDLEVDGIPVAGAEDDPTDELTELGNSIVQPSHLSDSHGNTIQVTNTVWSTRSLTESAFDYYYVEQVVANQLNNMAVGLPNVWSTLTDPAVNPVIVQSSPNTIESATTYTSGVSETIGGNAGYADGGVFNVSGSMTISNSKSTTVTETSITNASDLPTGVPKWEYATQCSTSKLENCKKTYTYTEHFIWTVPFDTYDSDQTSIAFDTTADAGYLYLDGIDVKSTSMTMKFPTSVPLPFNQTELGPPTVTNVDMTTASAGDTITLTGTNFYLIEGVLIGGNSVPESNYNVIESNTTMSVVIPAGQPTGRNQSIVINTDVDISDGSVTIHIK